MWKWKITEWNFVFVLLKKDGDWYIVFQGFLHQYLSDWLQIKTDVNPIELKILFREKNWKKNKLTIIPWQNLDLPF